MRINLLIIVITLVLSPISYAFKTITVDIYKLTNQESTKGIGQKIGEIVVEQTPYGVMFTPYLKGIAPGEHGFHVHQNPSCEGLYRDGEYVLGLAAGGHYDPTKMDKHQGPYDRRGHLGDLPVLYFDASGNSKTPIVAPRLKLKNTLNHSLVIHENGDNYSDDPKALGGGGRRIACGIVRE